MNRQRRRILLIAGAVIGLLILMVAAQMEMEDSRETHQDATAQEPATPSPPPSPPSHPAAPDHERGSSSGPSDADYIESEEDEGEQLAIEHQLAIIDFGWVREDDIRVLRFRRLLELLSKNYVEDRQQIADMTARATELLREQGIKESCLNIMEGLNRVYLAHGGNGPNQEYADYLAVYIAIRGEGLSHDEVIEGLQDIVNASP